MNPGRLWRALSTLDFYPPDRLGKITDLFVHENRSEEKNGPKWIIIYLDLIFTPAMLFLSLKVRKTEIFQDGVGGRQYEQN